VALIVFTRTVSGGEEMEFHLTLACGEPYDMKVRQGPRRLFFFQAEEATIKCAHSLLCAGRNKDGSMLQPGFRHA
jgi:hypothetical protein